MQLNLENPAIPHLQSPARRILVRGANWLGDAVMTTPALLRLREKFPGAHITLLTPEKLADLWTHHPAVDETISFAPGESVFTIGKKLRAGKFDLALVLPNSPRSALEVFLAGIPHRAGYARPWRNFFLTQTVPPRPEAVKMRKRTPRKFSGSSLVKQLETGNWRLEIPGGASNPRVSASRRRARRQRGTARAAVAGDAGRN